MSNKITNLCQPLRIRPTPKCVLMALADRADDDGVAWPSIAWLCEWTCFSRRAVMNALEELEGFGLVRVGKAPGKNSRCEIVLQKVADDVANPGTTCTGTRAGGAPVGGDDPCTTCTGAAGAPVQEVHTHPGTTCTGTRAGGAPVGGDDPCTTCTGAAGAPVQEVHTHPGTTCTGTRAGGAPVGGDDPCTTCTGAAGAPVQEVHTHPGTTCTGTRAGGAHGGAGGAPDTSITSIKTSNKTKDTRAKSGFDPMTMELPDWLPRDLWATWVKDRSDRKKPITEAAAQRQLATLARLRDDGSDPAAVIDRSIECGWQGFFATKDGRAPARAPRVGSGRHSSFEYVDYTAGVNADGTLPA